MERGLPVVRRSKKAAAQQREAAKKKDKARLAAAAAASRMDGEAQCAICMDASPNGRVVPCGHQTSCFPCALRYALSTRGLNVEVGDNGVDDGSRPNGRCSFCRGPVFELLAVAAGDQVTRSVRDLDQLPQDGEAARRVVEARAVPGAERALLRDVLDATAADAADSQIATLEAVKAEIRSRKLRTLSLRRKVANALANNVRLVGQPFIVEGMGDAEREVLLDSHMESFDGADEARSVLHLRRWLLCREGDPIVHHEIAAGQRMSTRRHVGELPPEQRELQIWRWRALVQVLKDDARAC